MALTDAIRNLYYESRGKAVHKTWEQNFEDHESRITRAFKRYTTAISDIHEAITNYLLEDGRIPGPLLGVVWRKQDLVASKLSPASTVDFRRGLRVTLLLDQDITSLTLVPPTLNRHEAVHVSLQVKQDSVGSRAITAYSSNVLFPEDLLPELTGTAGSVDILAGIADGTDGVIRIITSPGFSA